MHNFRPELFFINILLSVDKIKRNIKNVTFDQFVSDEKIFALVVRELQEIGESAKKLLQQQALLKCSDIKWEEVVAFRNLVVHKYFGIVPEMIFEIAQKELPSLEKSVLNLITQQSDKTYLFQAITDTKTVFTKMNRHKSIAYLEKIEVMLKA